MKVASNPFFMKLKLITSLAFLSCFCAPAIAQPPTTAAGYTFTASSSTYTYLSGGNSVSFSPNYDDGLATYNSSTSIPIGFQFNFCGTNYQNVSVGSNGFVTFNTSGATQYVYGPYDVSSCAPGLMPFTNDGDGSSLGSASFKTTGTSPNRVFTFEWKNWGAWNTAYDMYSVQVKLYESGFIEFLYNRESNASAENYMYSPAVIGICHSSSDYVFLNSTSSAPSTTTSNYPSYYSIPATGQSYLFSFCTTPSLLASSPSVNKCIGDNAIFNVNANNAVTYQWQENSGSGFSNISDNTTYSGTHTSTLTVHNIPNSYDGRTYRCILAGTCPTTVTTPNANITLLNSIKLFGVTPSSTVCEGNPFQVSVNASGSGLTYQWQVDNGSGSYADVQDIPPYSGAHTASMNISAVPGSMNNNKFRVNLSSLSSCAVNTPISSTDVKLSVNPAPDINPAAQNVNVGTNAMFMASTTADTSLITGYQWQADLHDGLNFRTLQDDATYSGTNTSMLMINNVGMNLYGANYRCIVWGICDGDPSYSTTATLTVSDPTGVVKTEKQNVLSLYPNPANDIVTISSSKNLAGSSVRVIDNLGRTLSQTEISANSNTEKYNIKVSGLPSGIYRIQVSNQNSVNETLPFVKN